MSAKSRQPSPRRDYSAVKPNLAPSLDLLADIVRNPAFAPAGVARLKSQQLAAISSEMADPEGITQRVFPALLYGNLHPYGAPFSGSGTTAAVEAITREDIIAAHRDWIRPDNAKIFVAGDASLAEILPLLESRFGSWRAPAGPRLAKNFDRAPAPSQPRIVLIDRPQAPQSYVLAATLLPVKGTGELAILARSIDALSGGHLSRVNMDLRETKGWAYGAGGSIAGLEHHIPYTIRAPVQTDKTGPAIAALREQIQAFLTTRGTTAEEVERVRIGRVRALPGNYETTGDVLEALLSNARLKRPDDYQERLARRYRSVTAQQLDQQARAAIDPNSFIFLVVGDGAKVRPQLQSLGMRVEEMAPR